MAQHRSTIDVPADPATVFAYLSDLTNAKAWDPSVVEAERENGTTFGAGARFRVVVAFFGRRIELRYTVEQSDPPATLVLRATGKSVERLDTITIAPSDGGSRVTYDSSLRLKGPLRMLDKGLQLQFTTMTERATAGLKERLAAPV
jgi:carbon monoxide dehydrogenase subunit G